MSKINNLSEKQFIWDFLASDAYLNVNKKAIKIFGLEESIFLSDLISKEKYFYSKDQLKNEYFFNTENNRQEDTGLTPYKQSQAIKKLTEFKIISVKREGLPAKQYFKIHHQILKNYFLNFKELEDKNLRTINKNKDNKNKSNNTISKEIDTDFSKSDNPHPDQDKSSQSKLKIVPADKYIIFSAQKLINKWNSFDHTSNHKTSLPHTSGFIKMVNNLISLQKGTFGRGGRNFDPEWIKNNKIPEEWFSKAWTYQELLGGIINLSKRSLDGYWPTKDKKDWKALPSLIYDSFHRRSQLLKAIKDPPQLIKDNQHTSGDLSRSDGKPYPEGEVCVAEDYKGD